MEILDRVRNAIAVYTEPRHYRHSQLVPPGISDDLLIAAADSKGWTRSSEQEYTEQQARADIQRIMESGASASIRFDALHLLDIQVQNQTENNRNAVINTICEQQYQLVKEMEGGENVL